MISTPRGHNWFYDEWKRGRDKLEGYLAWQVPSTKAPTIKPSEIDIMRRDLGVYRFRQEIMAEFEVAEGGLFKRDWFKLYDQDAATFKPENGPPVSKESVLTFATADLALTAKAYSDFSVIIAWARAADGRLFVLDLQRGKYEIPEVIPLLRRTQEQWNARSIFVESSGELANLNREAAQAGLPIVEYAIHAQKGKADKVQRAGPASAATEAGRVLLPRGAGWISDFLDELCEFPSPSALHDDCVDAYALGVLCAPAPTPGSHAPRFVQQPTPVRSFVQDGGGSWLRSKLGGRPWV
jgi:predicted phage terminase large subunit-like protein